MSVSRNGRALVAIVAGVSISTVLMASDGPYLGTLTGNEVNLRTGGSRNHPVFATVKLGQQLIVEREENGWCKVHIPRWIPLYVHKDYIDLSGPKGTVKAGQLNLRAFPRKGGSDECVGLLLQGSEVQVIGRDGDWIKIGPPVAAYAYLNKQFVTRDRTVGQADVPQLLAQLNDSPSPGLAKAVSRTAGKEGSPSPEKASAREPVEGFTSPALQKGTAILREIQAKNLEERDFSKAREYYEGLMESSDDLTEVEIAKSQLKFIQSLEDRDETIREGNRSIEEVARKRQEIQQAVGHATAPRRENSDPYLARGYVTGIGRYGGHKATHRLMKGSQVLYFLMVEDGNPISLDSFLFKRVGIKGVERELDPKFGANMIIVQSIEVLSER